MASTPRHVFVPRWWEPTGSGTWALRDGSADEAAWLRAAYSDTSLVTRVGPLHADQASPDDRPRGVPTSSGTMPSLVVRMLRHGLLYDGADLGLIGTGTGASTALASRRLGCKHVTAMDVDPYLTGTATDRLASLGMSPQVVTCDVTGPLPGDFDRIVSMVALRNLAGVTAAVRPGGHRLNAEGGLPIYGSRVHITPDGVCHFTRGKWSASYG
ncbi:methyltransferase domain-containing protein [Streptomyces javensis]|uniref:methyltransferase domain-containing protein n=1 Tax=Streptomyces javensis TaxID=114698 RepID=UPI002811EB85|nr:methyltransferase domain-containing protein [Streptomyces javensis]